MTTKIFLDVETTGLNVLTDRVIELGIVECSDQGIITGQLHFYFNNNVYISNESISIHGITADFLVNKKPFIYHVNQIVDFIKDKDIYMHNAQFDLSFMNKEFSLVGYKTIEEYCNNIIDTLEISRKFIKGSNSLSSLCKAYKLDYPLIKHSAILDATYLAKLFFRMVAKNKLIVNFVNTQKINSNMHMIEYNLLSCLKKDSEYIEHEQFIIKMFNLSGVKPNFEK